MLWRRSALYECFLSPFSFALPFTKQLKYVTGLLSVALKLRFNTVLFLLYYQWLTCHEFDHLAITSVLLRLSL